MSSFAAYTIIFIYVYILAMALGFDVTLASSAAPGIALLIYLYLPGIATTIQSVIVHTASLLCTIYYVALDFVSETYKLLYITLYEEPRHEILTRRLIQHDKEE